MYQYESFDPITQMSKHLVASLKHDAHLSNTGKDSDLCVVRLDNDSYGESHVLCTKGSEEIFKVLDPIYCLQKTSIRVNVQDRRLANAIAGRWMETNWVLIPEIAHNRSIQKSCVTTYKGNQLQMIASDYPFNFDKMEDLRHRLMSHVLLF